MKTLVTWMLFVLFGIMLSISQASATPCDLQELLSDDFEDGYDDWTVGTLYGWLEDRVQAPLLVPSPQGQAIGSQGSPGWDGVHIYQALPPNDGNCFKLEYNAKSAAGGYRSVQISLWEGDQNYEFWDYGEANQRAQMLYFPGPGNSFEEIMRHPLGQAAFEWHTFTWERDADGWWSLGIDGQPAATNFAQDTRLTSFEYVQVMMQAGSGSAVDWVSFSAVPEPSAFILAVFGFLGLLAFRRRKYK